MFLVRLLIFSIFINSSANNLSTDKKLFSPPLRIPLTLSANFGELRADHFHSGLDIKTQGATGKEVVAPADGFVYRISVSPTGFGRSLYIRHPSGYSTVYGHLERFNTAIDEYVKKQQYAKKSFTVTLYPDINDFPVKQGEIIAYSGNSGSSGGPHLHFEIRKTDGEKPINPLLFDSLITDNVSPVIEKLAIYPINKYSLVNDQNSPVRINVTHKNGTFTVPEEHVINVSGLVGFGIKAYDLLNDSQNRCGLYSIELFIDSISMYKYEMNSFSFDESRYINSHIDYQEYMKENSFIERIYVLPNDKLSLYKGTINRGIYNFQDDNIHTVKIVVSDINKNKSTLIFRVKSDRYRLTTNHNHSKHSANPIVMPYGETNKFESEGLSVRIPEGALYDTLNFIYKKEKGTPEMLSDIHFIHNKYTPVHIPFSISIKPTSIVEGKESKMLIIRLDDYLKKEPATSTWNEGYLTANVLSFGKYYVGIDTIAPVISPVGQIAGADLSGRKEIKIKIYDNLSGIRSYEPVIDNEWALFEYDQKNDVLIYRFDGTRVKKGSIHNFTLRVTDNKNNTNTFRCRFKW